jgi:cytochrome c biogenesis protein
MSLQAPPASPPAPGRARCATRVELLSSMRFAISLLTVICIASVIGTVVKQNEPYNNYVNQFGPFWAEVFGASGLYAVYSAWWFLLILAFLVTSTSLCIARNTPKILAELRSYKEGVREQALKSFHHKAEGTLALSPDGHAGRVNQLLISQGWQARAQVRGHGTMVAARKGMANKIGYLAAHSAIVLICLGGLFDGDLVVRAQMALLGKTPFTGGGLISDVPAEHRLSERNPTFRGNLLVPEGGRAGVAILNVNDGVVLQELPFDVELKKFIVDYYDTGMPKLFASQIVIHDHATGAKTEATVKVNEPAFHRGIAIYQSSFDDGGSKLQVRALPMAAGGQPFNLEGTVGGSTELRTDNDQHKLTLEFTGLRVINVENMGSAGAADSSGADVRKVDLTSSLNKHLGSGAKPGEKVLRNVGPSITYKLRDAAGQAREFNNYMAPVELDGQRVLLAGVRESPSEPFRYLRIPVDDNGSIDTWYRLLQGLKNPDLRDKAVRRYAAQSTPADKPEMAEQLRVTAARALGLFAGAEIARTAAGTPAAESGGLQALSDFVEGSVPEADRTRISEVLLRILNGSLFELAQLTREAAGQPPMKSDEATSRFMTQAVLSLSDASFYPAPVMIQLSGFDQVQASVFQMARAPGKNLVYLGAVLLIIGVFAMLYIRERRLWVWLAPANGGGTKLQAALSTTRRTLDVDAEFSQLSATLLATPPKDNPA